MTCFWITIFSFVFILTSFPVSAQRGDLSGVYHSETYEPVANSFIPVIQHILKLNTDSSFIYKKNSEQLKCSYVYAGNWQLQNGRLILEFSEDDIWLMEVNEGIDFCSLVKHDEGLIFFKSDPENNIHYSSTNFSKTNNLLISSRKKKKKELACPDF